jgi:hypothetical protein
MPVAELLVTAPESTVIAPPVLVALIPFPPMA